VLAERHPALHFVVQVSDYDPEDSGLVNDRITIQKRQPGTPQTVTDAGVYLLRLPPRISGVPGFASSLIKSELQAHLGVLRSNNAMLVLTAHLLGELEALDAEVEANTRARELSMLQLANESEMVEMSELADMIESSGNEMGRLIIVSKCRSRKSGMVAVGVKFQAYASH
jgi:hypothetical protein